MKVNIIYWSGAGKTEMLKGICVSGFTGGQDDGKDSIAC
jgi:hypothetical protein